MVQTVAKKDDAVATYTVLRPICIAGDRVDVGGTVELTKVQYTELAAAGKVGPLVVAEAKPAKGKAKAEEPAA